MLRTHFNCLISLVVIFEVIHQSGIATCLESNSVNHASVTTLTSSNGVNTTLTISNHICTREETYVEQRQAPTMQQVKVRMSNWCLDFPPRCSNYKTEFREVIKLENVTKTRTIRYCCDGYAGITSVNETVCKPICRGGCGRGYCQSPNECQCDAGYMGKHCTQRCSHDRWGDNCKNICRCRNQSVCDNRSGICHCTSGWTGDRCELPCPQGLHGVMCKKTCNCSSNRCNPQTGDCLVEENHNLPANVTTSMIESLNSTIVNITQNLNRIAKNLGTTETVTLLVPDTILDVTTPKTLQEVILIKPPDHPTPSIIVHQPGGGSKTPEVIHVITNWQQDHLKGSGDSNETRIYEAGLPALDSESRILTILLVVLLCIMVFLALGFLVIYKKFNFKRTPAPGPSDQEHDPNSKVFAKPLPDLPAFTQIIRNKVDGPEFYDCPTNNAVVKPPYCYARKESLYSVVPKSRKGSVDSHLYDEIRYPGAHKISHM